MVDLLSVITSVAGGLATGGGISLLVVRYVAKDWVVWRERVEHKIDRLQPEHVIKIEGLDLGRLSDHYEQVAQLSTTAVTCQVELARVVEELKDHEGRIRHLEAVERKG